MCHITGGGLLNFKRLSRYGFRITDPITPPAIFPWIQKTGGIDDNEMYRTFNMGMGYAYIVPKAGVPAVLAKAKGAQVVGRIIEEPGAFLKNKEIT